MTQQQRPPALADEPFGAAGPPPPQPVAPSTHPPEQEARFVGTGLFWTLIVGCIVALAIIIFMAQNAASSRVNFLSLHFHLPLAVLVLAAVLAGVVVDELAGVAYRHRRRRRMGERHELRRLQRR